MTEFSKDKKENQKRLPSHFKAQLSSRGITIDFSKEEIEKYFPHLVKEMSNPNTGSYYSLNSDIKDDYQNENEENNEISDKIGFSDENLTEDAERMEELKKRTTSRYDKDSELYYPKTEDFLRRCKDFAEADESLVDARIVGISLGQRGEQAGGRAGVVCAGGFTAARPGLRNR